MLNPEWSSSCHTDSPMELVTVTATLSAQTFPEQTLPGQALSGQPRVQARTGNPPRSSERRRAELTAQLLAEIAAADELERKRLQDEVAMLNMCVARSIASRYRDRGEAYDDVLQAAYLGLIKAVRRYDASHGKDFLSFAVPTISGEVKRHFRDCGWTVRPPRRIQELQSRISSVSSELAQQLHRAATPTEVAARLGVSADEVVEALAADGCFTPTSLDKRVGDDGGASLGDLLGEEDADLSRIETHVALIPLVRDLAPRDRHIVTLRFFRGWTQEQIALDIGVTQMQVSRLLARILRDMRSQIT